MSMLLMISASSIRDDTSTSTSRKEQFAVLVLEDDEDVPRALLSCT